MKQFFKLLTIVVLIGEQVDFSKGFSGGPPPSICASMKPGHQGTDPQSGTTPYELTPSSQILDAGDTLSLELKSTGNEKFKGFMVQAFESGTNTRIGEFEINSE